MKIIVCSTGESIDSEIDARFGRCKYFVIVETENKEIKNVSAVENQGALQGHGAGIRAVEQVGEIKADVVIAGHLGPNASRVLSQLQIKAYQGSGTIKDAVMKHLNGELTEITDIAKPHSGMN
jgi:predicted Fe-Mo cluster-binding NifX family protein